MNRFVFILLLGALLGLTSCQDLTVENTNDPDRLRALSEPDAVETLISGSWPVIWSLNHVAAAPVDVMPLVADEFTATFSSNGSLDMAAEPRTRYNNNQTAETGVLASALWYGWYEALSNANEALFAIEQNGLRLTTGLGDEDNTARGQAFSRFIQGVSLGYVGLLFDQGSIADETTDLADAEALAYHPYDEVIQAAIASLEKGIAVAEANSFTVPGDWVRDEPVSNDRLARIMHSYIARLMVLGARTPEERAAVDWTAVINHTLLGIRQHVLVTLESGEINSRYLAIAQNTGSFSMRADYKLIGPADVSGAYQEWLNTPLNDRTKFLIDTPDRRITGPDGPTTDGKYFRYLETETFSPDRGTYHFSYYQWFRYGGRWTNGPVLLMSVDEMNLYRAEGLLRLGQLEEAASLINRTRVIVGELPPVTVEGVPKGGDCVPRTQSGACGSLLDALAYERMLELAGMDALRAFLDRRGFGTLTEGTFLHLPVAARELETIGEPVYSFGGIGNPGSADAVEDPE